MIASGTALLANSELNLKADQLPIKISFISDSGDTRWESVGSRDTGVLIKLFNMKNPLGEGVFVPISIAKSETSEFFISFYVTTINNGTQRVVVYNLFQKGGVR